VAARRNNPATDNGNCFVALQLHEYIMLKLYFLFRLALHVSATKSHCIKQSASQFSYLLRKQPDGVQL